MGCGCSCLDETDVEQKTRLLSGSVTSASSETPTTKPQERPQIIFHPPIIPFPLEIATNWIDPKEGTLIDPSSDFEIEVGNRSVSIDILPDHFKLHFPKQDSFYQYHFAHEPHGNFGGDAEIGTVVVSFMVNDAGTHLIVRDGYCNTYLKIPQILSLKEAIEKENLPFTDTNLRQLNVSPDDIAQLDEKLIITKYKFGIVYCAEGQTTELEWLGNNDPSPGFDKFINLLGDRIVLKNWQHYKAGLDVDSDTSGTHSLYTRLENYEIMFHVSTMLDHALENEQQVGKKRYIGNDIVLILFKEGEAPINPAFRSQYNHIFVVVQEDPNIPDNYLVGVARKPGVDISGPPIPNPPSIPGSMMREFLLYKCLNAEWTTYRSRQFGARLNAARQTQLQLLMKPKPPKKQASVG